MRKKAREIIELLKNTEKKSDEPAKYEIALTKAFSYLGFEANTIGGKGDTDVLLTANIGECGYKVDIDGKTSRSGKVSEAQISWPSLKDHKEKNNSDFVIVVGPDFAGGNLLKRAKEYNISLLKTDELIKIVKAHSKYPFTLIELKDLFSEYGYLTEQINDLIYQNNIRRELLEKFKLIIEEIEKLQNSQIGYFTLESIAGREKIQELEIEIDDIKNIIQLLKIPFINALTEISENKFIITLGKKELSNIFKQISILIAEDDEKPVIPITEIKKKNIQRTIPERILGTKYFKWEKRGNSIIALARKEKPYEHFCPTSHFNTICDNIIRAFSKQNVINNDTIYRLLENKAIAPIRIFKGKSEEYKIRLVLGILELENFINWTGSKRPIEYTLKTDIKNIKVFVKKI